MEDELKLPGLDKKPIRFDKGQEDPRRPPKEGPINVGSKLPPKTVINIPTSDNEEDVDIEALLTGLEPS